MIKLLLTDACSLNQLFRMGNFIFWFRNVQIWETRSPNTDTDFASLAVKIGSQSYSPDPKFIGELDGNSSKLPAVDLRVGPVDVPEDNTPVDVAWNVVNSGYHDPEMVRKALSAAASTAALYLPGGVYYSALVGYLFGRLPSIFARNHDGVCVAQSFITNGHALNSLPAGQNVWLTTKDYHLPGDNSDYTSTVVIFRPGEYAGTEGAASWPVPGQSW